MRVLIGGEDIGCSSITLRQSVFEYTTVLTFVTSIPVVSEEFVLETSSKTTFIPVRVEQVSRYNYQYVCYPKGYIEFLNSLTDPISIEGDTTDLFRALSICKFEALQQTQRSRWVLPSMRGISVVKKALETSSAVNGGCPCMFFTINGTLLFCDVIAECFDQAKGEFDGTLKSNATGLSFMNQVAGRVKFSFYTEDTFEERDVTFLENSGVVHALKYVVTEDQKEFEIRRYQSAFWRKYVAGSVSVFTEVQSTGLHPGLKYSNMSGRGDFICISNTIELQGNFSKVSAEMLPVIKPNQKL